MSTRDDSQPQHPGTGIASWSWIYLGHCFSGAPGTPSPWPCEHCGATEEIEGRCPGPPNPIEPPAIAQGKSGGGVGGGAGIIVISPGKPEPVEIMATSTGKAEESQCVAAEQLIGRPSPPSPDPAHDFTAHDFTDPYLAGCCKRCGVSGAWTPIACEERPGWRERAERGLALDVWRHDEERRAARVRSARSGGPPLQPHNSARWSHMVGGCWNIHGRAPR
jgi:hypothetical protein